MRAALRSITKEAKIEKKTKPAEEESDWTEEVIGAAIEVHRILGSGFRERTYEAALMIELRGRGIHAAAQVPIRLQYKGEDLGDGFMDLLVEESLVVELKATEGLSEAKTRQVLTYLHATKRRTGLLLNFNEAYLRDGVKRVVRS